MAGVYSQIGQSPAPFYDAFGRSRVSEPHTIFDSKLIFDDRPLYWDDQETSGSGTGSSHSANRASSTLSVSATTAGTRVRQTRQRFNYQPGKSQLVMVTSVPVASGGGAGITHRLGYFDGNNGVFFQVVDDVPAMVIRSNVTGTPVDTVVPYTQWNGDKLDGGPPYGMAADFTKSQIWFCDIEWLGVGSVRTGFIINGQFFIAHTFHHANLKPSVYMSTPNLPVRYELSNDGTGAASELECVCATVISEGGVQPQGQLHYLSKGGAPIIMGTSGTMYLALALRLKTTHIGESIDLVYASALESGTVDFEWRVIFNPTYSATPSWIDHDDSGVQQAFGAGTITLSGGHEIAGGYVKGGNNSGQMQTELQNALRLGSLIDGTRDTIAFGVRPLANNATIYPAIGWRELA